MIKVAAIFGPSCKNEAHGMADMYVVVLDEVRARIDGLDKEFLQRFFDGLLGDPDLAKITKGPLPS